MYQELEWVSVVEQKRVQALDPLGGFQVSARATAPWVMDSRLETAEVQQGLGQSIATSSPRCCNTRLVVQRPVEMRERQRPWPEVGGTSQTYSWFIKVKMNYEEQSLDLTLAYSSSNSFEYDSHQNT